MKPNLANEKANLANLLIVPEGIETMFFFSCFHNVLLLIVPEGIETHLLSATVSIHLGLLIVPEGIETPSTIGQSILLIVLLIVPEGIETQKSNRLLWKHHTFNRTRRN